MTTHTDISRSAALYERALKVLPGGVSRNAIMRATHPTYVDFGKGCRVTDLEGVTRIDFSNNMASMIHGHACPEITRAVTEQLSRGTAFMLGTESEVCYAEHLCSRNSAFEKLRFVNSGTEAIMVALKAARAYTGRSKIVKAEGAYHGVYDYAEVSQEASPSTWGSIDRPCSVPLVRGTPESTVTDVVIIPFNDTERALAILAEHADDIACVLIDLMPHRIGLHPADAGFVKALREWTTRHGALLVFDEVITFRTEYAGMQSRYGVTPDLTALGKMIGGGFPIGAVAGRADVMDVLNPRSSHYLFPHSGTYTANPISMTAGMAAMKKFDKAAVTRLNALADRAQAGIVNAISATGVRACVTGAGSMFRVHMKPQPPRDYRAAYPTPDETRQLKALIDHLFAEGCIIIGTGSSALSTPMTEVEIDTLVNAFKTGFAKLAAMK